MDTIAVGGRTRGIVRLRRRYGPGRWRKLKGFAMVRLASGHVCRAELHWYEARGKGRKKIKIKRIVN